MVWQNIAHGAFTLLVMLAQVVGISLGFYFFVKIIQHIPEWVSDGIEPFFNWCAFAFFIVIVLAALGFWFWAVWRWVA